MCGISGIVTLAWIPLTTNICRLAELGRVCTQTPDIETARYPTLCVCVPPGQLKVIYSLCACQE